MALKLRPGRDQDIPDSVTERIRRGRDRMLEGKAKRAECLSFWRGNHYAYSDEKNVLRFQPTVTHVGGGGKEPWRVRQSRNLLQPIVRHEVSSATQRVPSYEVGPSTSDPEDVGAARLSEKVALYGYDAWRVRTATEAIVTYAVVADEGFAWAFWDTQQGPFIKDTPVRLGDVAVKVFGRNEVFWEPGLQFDDSPWHGVEQAQDAEAVKNLPGYIGPEKLKPDADIGDSTTGQREKEAKNLVRVTHYLERPCPDYRHGRWLTLAAGKQILPERAYPNAGVPGLEDEPALRKLAYVNDPDSDTGQGLVRHLLDAMRTINDCTNKQVELKNHALVPQLLAPKGSLKTRLTSEPGAVFYYEVTGGNKPEWRPAPDGQILVALQRIKEEAKEDMFSIAAQNDIPTGVEAGKAIQALIERDQNARQGFLGNLADFHSRLMRDCLALVQRHYTEPRLLQIRGRFGPEQVQDFQGAHLRGQVDVRVFPASIEPRTRQGIEQKVMTLFQLGLITNEQALAGLNGGTGERLVDSYELDVARANLIIQKLKMGAETLFAEPDAPGPDGSMIPGWMPRPGIDNPRVHMAVLSDFAKTTEFDGLEPGIKQAVYLYLQALRDMEAEEAARAAMMQQQQAEGLGMANAAKPQAPPPMPSLPKAA